MSWESSYRSVLSEPPVDKLLTARSGEEIKINVEMNEGKPPFAYAVAYVHNVVGEEPEWYLQAKDQVQGHGWKAILLPRARQEYMKDPRAVYSLKIVRVSQSGKSLLAELI